MEIRHWSLNLLLHTRLAWRPNEQPSNHRGGQCWRSCLECVCSCVWPKKWLRLLSVKVQFPQKKLKKMSIAWRQRAPGAAFFTRPWPRTPLSCSPSVLRASCVREVTSAAPVVIQHYTAHWCRRNSVSCASRDHVGPNSAHICLHEGSESVNGPWTERGVLYQHGAEPLLHYWCAIWLPTINKLLRNWKLWSLTALGPTWPPTGWLSTAASLTVELRAALSTINLESSIPSPPTGFSRWVKAISLPPCVMQQSSC